MNVERFLERRAEYLTAVSRLEEACEQPFSSFMRDSVIQRFEFSWELSWKMMLLWLEHLGVEVVNPRDTFREALNKKLITDGNLWSDLQKMRNLTSHTYNEMLADEVYAFIRAKGLGLFQQLAEECRTWQPNA